MDDSKQLTLDEMDFAVGGALQVNSGYMVQQISKDPNKHVLKPGVLDNFLVSFDRIGFLASKSWHLP